jgi:peptidoglycan LD-endopeptidase LytH
VLLNISSSSVSLSHPVIYLPLGTPVLDMTNVSDRHPIPTEYAIGRYNEKRTGVYTKEIFGGVRNIHMGIDIFAPVGTLFYAFADGQIYGAVFHGAEGDYGSYFLRHL